MYAMEDICCSIVVALKALVIIIIIVLGCTYLGMEWFSTFSLL